MRTAVGLEWASSRRATFSPAVRAGDFVVLSGMGSIDAEGEVMFPGDVAGQAKQIYANISDILATIGCSLDDVIKTVDYITDEALGEYKETAKVRREIFSAPYPAATGLVVQGLLRPGMVIEIDAWAHAPQSGEQ